MWDISNIKSDFTYSDPQCNSGTPGTFTALGSKAYVRAQVSGREPSGFGRLCQ
jgi:hypothetical protein